MTYVERSREPLRDLVNTPERLDQCLAALRAGDGPVAFDTERAHGHRYWPRAYLLQIRRQGAGTWLIDPIAFGGTEPADLSCLIAACGDARWIVHAASQDLPSMRELKIVPQRIFDTEMAARLLGKPGAALGALLEAELGIKLRKAHSADNWSKRPLPESWLTYAALDVDYLIELAEVIRADLERTGRLAWAEQEDAETLARFGVETPARTDPWRRLSGITALRTPRQFAVARELWLARDAIAQRRDRPPGWILHDSAILAVATRSRDRVPERSELMDIAGFGSQPGQRYLSNWIAALDKVREMTTAQYPAPRPRHTGIPHPRSWAKVDADAAARWAAVRPVVDELACDLGGLQPSLVAPPTVLHGALFTNEAVTRERLLALGARPWQADFLAPAIQEALAD